MTDTAQASCSFVEAVRLIGWSQMQLDTGNGVSLEQVGKFYYLRDILDADGGCDTAVTAIESDLHGNFLEYLLIITGKGFLLKLKL